MNASLRFVLSLALALSVASGCGDDDGSPSGAADTGVGDVADAGDSGADAPTADAATADAADSASTEDTADDDAATTDDADEDGGFELDAACASFFEDNAGSYAFVPNPDRAIDPLGSEFGSDAHEVVIASDGTMTASGATTTYTFAPGEITSCVTTPEVNVQYVDADSGVRALLQLDTGNWALELFEAEAPDTSRASLSLSGTPEALYAALAGTYDVAEVTEGAHTRQTVTISADGAIDFDEGDAFMADELSEAYDRVDACGGYWAEFNKGDGSGYPRFNLYVDDAGALEQIWFYPDYPNAGLTVVLIQAGAGEPNC